MGTKQVTRLAAARLADPSGHLQASSAAQGMANCAIAAMPGGTSFTSKWYRNPERLMSQSERLPS